MEKLLKLTLMIISIKDLSRALLVFAAGFVAASLLAVFMIQRGNNVNAQGLTCKVDKALVEKIYDAVFKRPIDNAGLAYVGYDVGFMIDEMAKSQEHKMYTAMFTSMKAMEEAERQPGEMTEADKAKFRNMMDSSMSHITSWSKTLPEQAATKAIIGPEHAQEALNFAHSMIPKQFQDMANKSFFDPTKLLGAPTDIAIPTQFKLSFDTEAQARLQQEIQERIAQETQFRTQIETQYQTRQLQEAEFTKQYGQQTTQLTPEQQATFLQQYQQKQTLASPTPAPSPASTASATPAPTPTPAPTASPTPSPTPASTPTPTPVPTASPTP